MSANFQGPWMRTPLCHITGLGGQNLYMGGICSQLEIQANECLEAYGYQKGLKYCRGYLDDYQECRSRRKQLKRRDAMEQEMKRQYNAGLIKERYVPTPERDAF